MTTTRLAIAAVAVLLLAGCSATPAEQPAPELTRSSTGAIAPDIPLSSSLLTAPRTPVPPVSVEVPAAGIVVSVVPVGVQPDGLMELPADVKVAGWYEFGADPLSETGTTVISAHVDSIEYGLGPFSALKGLGAGTEIVVTVASGEQVRYVVETVTSVRKDQLPLAEVFDRAGASRLVLITCGGQFDYSASSYSDNVVVTAVPVAS